MTDPLTDRDPAHTDDETREAFIRRVFGGERRHYDEFVDIVRDAVPPNASVIVRGSSVTGERHSDGAPFDADGPGTSDIDLTFVGGDMVKLYDSFHIPGIHSVPYGEDHPDAAPALAPLRERLCALAGRHVNIQATTDLVQYVRDVTMNQPYLVLLERREGDAPDAPPEALPEALPEARPEAAPEREVPNPASMPMLGPL
jgi:hypothetical protein